MQNNVVIAVFEDEAKATEAFDKIIAEPAGEGYAVPEVALIKNDAETGPQVLAGVGVAPAPARGTGKGIVIGGLVGLLAGAGVVPTVLFAAIGGTAGSRIATRENIASEVGNANAVIAIASKVYEGEVAIAALVSEEEPAFDAAFEGFEGVTIVRYDAADIADDVERLYELEAAVSDQVLDEMKADRKAARAERREERRARIHAQLEEYAAATNRSMGIE